MPAPPWTAPSGSPAARLLYEEHLAGVQNVLWIERALQSPHERQFLGGSAQLQISSLLKPDAVLGRYRALSRLQSAVDDLFNLPARFHIPGPHVNIEVQI